MQGSKWNNTKRAASAGGHTEQSASDRAEPDRNDREAERHRAPAHHRRKVPRRSAVAQHKRPRQEGIAAAFAAVVAAPTRYAQDTEINHYHHHQHRLQTAVTFSFNACRRCN